MSGMPDRNTKSVGMGPGSGSMSGESGGNQQYMQKLFSEQWFKAKVKLKSE